MIIIDARMTATAIPHHITSFSELSSLSFPATSAETKKTREKTIDRLSGIRKQIEPNTAIVATITVGNHGSLIDGFSIYTCLE